ncbi:hypothetical protein EDC18_1241 [Natranaerovirga pectinivora]|uniref:Uncharacterized protein n=1 Tax=Natranaerovirga pectinivora TaxID=682400 RepID=A0A4R3MA80_9FIRM|nr:hypothetical protein [Natranaerovirga pectinivora]TCT10501.1 hypothetical protein EDC18_1241 [Natranaerovirga pectinivora]
MRNKLNATTYLTNTVIGWEKLLHRLLVDSSLNGEWYLCDDSFMYNFNNFVEAINDSSILNDNFELLEVVSFEEAEILLHSHNIKFSLIETPIKKNANIIEHNITVCRLKEIISDNESLTMFKEFPYIS